MRVVYSVATKINGGGIGTTSYQAILGIERAGFLSKVICSSQSKAVIPQEKIYTTNTSFAEKLRFLPSSYRWLLKDVLHDLLSLRYLEGLPEPIDIFHVWNGHGLYSLRRAKKMGAITIVERASSHPLSYERIMKEESRIRGIQPQYLLSINKKRLLAELSEVDYITVPSDFSYQSMLENGIPASKLVKLPFGVDLDLFRPNPSDVQRSTFNALFVGQVGFRKGAAYLLEAWQKLGLKNAKLRLLGQEDPVAASFLKRFKNDPSIEFLGYNQSLKFYQESDVFVFPSLEEGSALVTYEALACGLPVITTFESGSVVEDGEEGYIIPARNGVAIADRIKYLYDNAAIRRQMAIKARARAEKYSWERYGLRLTDSYKKIF